MLPHMATEQENVTTFLREIEVMQQLTHPNIVHCLTMAERRTRSIFVLSFVDGMFLHQLIQTRKSLFRLKKPFPIMSGTLDGLAYAHHVIVTMEISSGERARLPESSIVI
jgi:serine/threonine protein kinase